MWNPKKMKPEAQPEELEMTNVSLFVNSFNSSRDNLFRSSFAGSKDHRSFRAMLESSRRDIHFHSNNYHSKGYDTSSKINEGKSDSPLSTHFTDKNGVTRRSLPKDSSPLHSPSNYIH